MRLVWELSDVIPDNAMVAADSGSSANWYARHLRMRGHMRGSLSGNLATMGPGVPYAIGAKFAHPDRPAVALVGDGAMQMNGMAELITISRYYAAMVRSPPGRRRPAQQRPQPGHLGDAGHGGRPQVRGIPDAARASPMPALRPASGLQALEVHEPDELKGAWSKAFAADRPPSSMSIPILTSRRFRRTPPSNRSKTQPRRCSRVTRTPWASSAPGSNRRCRSSCPPRERSDRHDGGCSGRRPRPDPRGHRANASRSRRDGAAHRRPGRHQRAHFRFGQGSRRPGRGVRVRTGYRMWPGRE